MRSRMVFMQSTCGRCRSSAEIFGFADGKGGGSWLGGELIAWQVVAAAVGVTLAHCTPGSRPHARGVRLVRSGNPLLLRPCSSQGCHTALNNPDAQPHPTGRVADAPSRPFCFADSCRQLTDWGGACGWGWPPWRGRQLSLTGLFTKNSSRGNMSVSEAGSRAVSGSQI